VRVSTAKQVESGLGLSDQRARLEAYCALRGLEIASIVTDEGESAGKPLGKRTGGAQLLEMIRKRSIDAVVVLKLDRAFRNASDALATSDAWDRAGIALHVADMAGSAMDTTSAAGRMFLTMLAGFAEFERNLVAERTTAALAHKARSGDMRLGKDAPYGWKYEGKALVLEPKEQEILAFVRGLSEQGLGTTAICRELSAKGLKNRAGTDFKRTQIDRMLLGSVRQMHAAERPN